ncbi:hypothetical protein J4Q44_G00238000 [Coregonus suidteri]|uniref:CRAL-TRIO domain-containing protein n=1 Tax=Coregonus suidteri TaxID=861788 RepID=A0AAN8LEN9_9TELE
MATSAEQRQPGAGEVCCCPAINRTYTELLRRECQKQTEKLGKNVEVITLIYYCEGVGLKHMWKPGEILTMFEENYPEGLKRVFLINSHLESTQ